MEGNFTLIERWYILAPKQFFLYATCNSFSEEGNLKGIYKIRPKIYIVLNAVNKTWSLSNHDGNGGKNVTSKAHSHCLKFHQFVKCRGIFLELNSQALYLSSEKKKTENGFLVLYNIAS